MSRSPRRSALASPPQPKPTSLPIPPPPSIRTIQQVPGYLQCIQDAPTYGADQRMPAALRAAGVPVSIVASEHDELCPPALETWFPEGVPRVPGSRLVHLRSGWIHAAVCMNLNLLRLHNEAEMWGCAAWQRDEGRDAGAELSSRL